MVDITRPLAAAALALAISAGALAGDRPVEEALKARTEASKAKIPAEAAQAMDAGIQAVKASGIVEKSPKVGDKAKPFTLPDANGKPVKLGELLGQGPVVLTWYRGGWCPYCNIGLQGLVKVEPRLRELGATLVAVTPELPDSSTATVGKGAVPFVVLTDKGNAVAKEYGIVFKLGEQVAGLYKQFGIDLAKSNGDKSNELPLAVTYVIDRAGVIRYAFADADYKKRAEPADVVAALEKLAK